MSAVLVEEERFELNLEEFVLDSGQEMGPRPVQLGVCKTSANNGHVLIRFNFCLSIYYISNLGAFYNNGTQKLYGFMPAMWATKMRSKEVVFIRRLTGGTTVDIKDTGTHPWWSMKGYLG